MKNKLFLLGIIILTSFIPIQAQDDVNLFDFWKYYSDAENAMYKSSCSLAFKQLSERKEAIAQLQSESDYLQRQEEIKDKLLKLIRDQIHYVRTKKGCNWGHGLSAVKSFLRSITNF